MGAWGYRHARLLCHGGSTTLSHAAVKQAVIGGCAGVLLHQLLQLYCRNPCNSVWLWCVRTRAAIAAGASVCRCGYAVNFRNAVYLLYGKCVPVQRRPVTKRVTCLRCLSKAVSTTPRWALAVFQCAAARHVWLHLAANTVTAAECVQSHVCSRVKYSYMCSTTSANQSCSLITWFTKSTRGIIAAQHQTMQIQAKLRIQVKVRPARQAHDSCTTTQGQKRCRRTRMHKLS